MAETAIQPSAKFYDQKTIQGLDESRLHCSMQIDAYRFTICLVDNKNNQLLAYEAYDFVESTGFLSIAFDLEALFQHSQLLNTKAQFTTVAVRNIYSTIIPNALFNEVKMEAYLNSHFTILDDVVLLVDELPNLKAKNVFAVHNSVYHLLKKKYGLNNVHHASSFMIEQEVLDHKTHKGNDFVIELGVDFFQLLAFKDHQLVLQNSFTYQNEDDFVYFVLFTMEQLKMDQGSLNVSLITMNGNIDGMREKLSPYVGSLQSRHAVLESAIPSELDSSLMDSSYCLFKQHLCEL